MAQHRAVFDFRITFTNGGGLSGTGFRIDVPEPNVTEQMVSELVVRELGLLMVASVAIDQMRIIEEAHRAPTASRAPDAGGRLVELSHSIAHGMITYPGLPGPEIGQHLSRDACEGLYGPGVRFHIGQISMIANTGTYLDTPFHRFDGAPDLAEVPLARVAGLGGIVVRVTGSARRAVDVTELAPYDVAGRAVLVHTGWDRHWRTEQYGIDAPFLTRAATDWLVAHGAALLGIDSVNIDDIADRTRPAHTGLLRAGIPIVEHLCRLDQLPPVGFRFHAAPPRVERLGTFPVRAYAVLA